MGQHQVLEVLFSLDGMQGLHGLLKHLFGLFLIQQ